MTRSLMFVVAPAEALPDDTTTPSSLHAAQARGPSAGFALRLFSRGEGHPDLSRLPVDGRLTGDQRRSAGGSQLICDATVPLLEPQHHWLGVYRGQGDGAESLQCLDRLPLSEASNATCWFYPTHDGLYLSWERGLRLSLMPGRLADAPGEQLDADYDRGRLAVLWSLLGDDASLTCVGLTYGGRRIDWPVRSIHPEPMATWGRFRLDSQADVSLMVEDCRTVFQETTSGE